MQKPTTKALAKVDPPLDLSELIGEIQRLFWRLAQWDPAFGHNNYPLDEDGQPRQDGQHSARFQGWQHPTLVAWATARGKADPRHDLDGPELYILRASLQKKLSEFGGNP